MRASGGGVVVAEAALELVNKRGDGGLAGVEEEHLLSGDDGLDVLQIYHHRPLPSQHRRRVRQLRSQYPQVPHRKLRPAHDRVLPGLHHLRPPRRVQHQPGPDATSLLPQRRSPRGIVLAGGRAGGAFAGAGAGLGGVARGPHRIG